MELKTLVELTEHEASAVMQMVRHVVQMRELGLIVTVENRPLLPLAMGHHEPLITVYRRIDHKAEAAKRGGYPVSEQVEEDRSSWFKPWLGNTP